MSYETLDIEVRADLWEEEQRVFLMLAKEEEAAARQSAVDTYEDDKAAYEAEHAMCHAEHLFDMQREDDMLVGRMS